MANKQGSNPRFLYAAREISTGELVSDITNPHRKYWDKRGNAVNAIENYNRCYAGKDRTKCGNKGAHGELELVTFALVEIQEDR